eukprot:TRINITY_DN4801_c5_g1_i1.p1 TRINITY_DN4801_c5_g1~~TRINITY_DN4801_c5_g1_i1.p1  ORF type:complete len:357 (-),score=66.99 TRINITY_DN4801_c5_g1_i1:48-1118(-)
MSQSKITALKQKVQSKIHRQKTDTSHMTGKNTDLPATRSAALNQSGSTVGSRLPSENPNHEHNPGVVTATQSTHFDHASHHSDPVTQNMDHVIRQDSEEGLYNSNSRGMDLNRNGIPDALERNHAQSTGHYVAPGQYMNDLNRNGIPDALEGTRRSGEYISPARYMNDLNRNGIPDSLEHTTVLPLGSQTLAQPAMRPSVVATDSIEKFDCQVITKPAIVHEVIKNEETHQVQPVIERTREQTDVYEVVQPITEREVLPTEVRVATLPAKHIPIIRETEFIEAQATIPVQIIKTVHVPVSQLTQVTTTRMMTASEVRSYETAQLPGQFMEKTQLGSTSATTLPMQTTMTTQQSQAF